MTDIVQRIVEVLDGIAPGDFSARRGQPLAKEAQQFATALDLTKEHDGKSNTWRLITVLNDDGTDWLNLGFMGNGPSSEAVTKMCAAAPTLLAEAVKEIEELRRQLSVREGAPS